MSNTNDFSNRPVWLLCEGKDCYFFFMRVLERLKMDNVYCLDVKGINDSDLFEGVNKKTNYTNAKVIVYARDAEYPDDKTDDEKCKAHFASVIQSIQSRFQSIGLTVGGSPFALTTGYEKQAGYIILTDSNGSVGTLEDLCIAIAIDLDAVSDATNTINCVNESRNDKVRKHIHKRKLHIAFALNENDNMVGARTGDAVLNGGLNLDHIIFKPIRDFLVQINEQ
jgi:hypothetical protein